MRDLPATTQTVYANLLQMHLNRPVGEFVGAPFKREKEGKHYWYATQRLGNSSPRQIYIGPDTDENKQRIRSMQERGVAVKEFKSAASKAIAQLRAAGLTGLDRQTGSVLRALTNSGVFRLGGTLVGTQAFNHYSQALGVEFTSENREWVAQTEDVDIASFEKLSMAIEDVASPELSLTLEHLGFQPANSLYPKKPTSWTLPGSTYAIDFLAPSFSDKPEPVKLAALDVWAQGLHYLNFLIKEPIPVIAIYMEGLLVQIPSPERYAIHKLIVSQLRNAAMQTKAKKDLEQAKLLIEFLLQTRPYELKEVLEEAYGNGPKWRQILDRDPLKVIDRIRGDF